MLWIPMETSRLISFDLCTVDILLWTEYFHSAPTTPWVRDYSQSSTSSSLLEKNSGARARRQHYSPHGQGDHVPLRPLKMWTREPEPSANLIPSIYREGNCGQKGQACHVSSLNPAEEVPSDQAHESLILSAPQDHENRFNQEWGSDSTSLNRSERVNPVK